MPEVRITVSLNQHTLDILDDAGVNLWPEFGGNRSALVRKVASDWHRMRTENGGGRTARITALEHDSSVMQERMHQIEQRVALIERRLGIGQEDA